MLSQVITVNTPWVDLKMLTNRPLHTCCIQKSPCANHTLLGQARVVLKKTGNHIYGIGNDNQYPIKTNPHQLLGHLRNLGSCKRQFCKTVCIWIVLKGNLTQGGNHHIRICQGLIIIHHNIGMIKCVHGRILIVYTVCL